VSTDRLTHLRGRTASLFSRNLLFKLLSLIFAVFIWAWVQTEQVVDERFRARVVYMWPNGLMRVQEVPKSLVVTLKGPQGLIKNIEDPLLSYHVDLSDEDIGPVSVDFSAKPLGGLPDGVKVVQVSPPAADIQLDRRLEREVRVKEMVIGTVAEGWRQDSVTVSPETVQISGPQSLVRQISEVATDVVDVGGLTNTTQFDVTLALKERTVTALKTPTVAVTVAISPIIVAKIYKDIPVLTRAPGWRATPASAAVTLEGSADDIKSLSPEQISVQVHLPDPAPTGDTFSVSFDAAKPRNGLEVVHQGPEGVQVVKVQPSSVQLERNQ